METSDSTEDNTTEFIRLILFSFQISLKVVKTFTKYNILPNYRNSLTEFLTHHFHKIYHLWINDTRCCQPSCDFDSLDRVNTFSKNQFQTLYTLSNTAKPDHFIKKHNKIVQYCFCGITVNASCSLEKLDLTLLISLLQNCGLQETQYAERDWLKTIREIRNKLVHVESTSDFDRGRLTKWREKLEGSVLGLASKIEHMPEYQESIESQIEFLKKTNYNATDANKILNQLKEENKELIDVVVKENERTRNIILTRQKEDTELLRSTIHSVGDDVIRRQDERSDRLEKQVADLTFEFQQLKFEVTKHSFAPFEQRKFDKGTTINRRHRFEWLFHTPLSWKVSDIVTILQRAGRRVMNHLFRIESVHEGSLVIITSVYDEILEDKDLLTSAIESFLRYIVTQCGLKTDIPQTVNVSLKFMPEHEDDLSDTRGTETTSQATTTKNMSCDVCKDQNKNVQASTWCFECRQRLCVRCDVQHARLKTTKQHTTIPVEHYLKLPTNISDINPNCELHHLPLILYCVDHTFIGCEHCISDQHNACSNVKPVDDVIKNVKKSYSFERLEEKANDIIQIAKCVIAEASSSFKTTTTESKRVIAAIIDTRSAIDKHLDEIQGDFIEDFESKINRKETSDIISGLNALLKTAIQLSNEIKETANHAPEFHTFFNFGRWNEKLLEQEENLALLQEKLSYLDSVDFEINPDLSDLKSKIKEFGSFSLKLYQPEKIELRKEKDVQAIVQYFPEMSDTRLPVAFAFSPSVEMGKLDIKGCCILNSGILVLTDESNTRLGLYDTTSQFIKEIQLNFHPYDVTAIDNAVVGVTSRKGDKLILIDTTTGYEVRRINIGGRCSGVSYDDLKIAVIIHNNIIRVLDLDGNILSDFELEHQATHCCMVNDTLYYAVRTNDTIYCSDMTGEVNWQYKCDDGKFPSGIAVDEMGNLFVTCVFGNNVVYIDKNGDRSKVLLSRENGMNNPLAISYSKMFNLLLVCNSNLGNSRCFGFKTR